MNILELRSNFHSLIDKIDNPDLLQAFYVELMRNSTSSGSGAWASLSEDQRMEVLLAYEESEDDENLLTNEEVMGKYGGEG